MGLHEQFEVLGGLSFFNSRSSFDRTLALSPYLLPTSHVCLLMPERELFHKLYSFPLKILPLQVFIFFLTFPSGLIDYPHQS